MKRVSGIFVAGAVLALTSIPSEATYNATVTGTVAFVQPISGLGFASEAVAFGLTNQPTISCNGYQQFIISATVVPDAGTRKNMYAALLTAKATGASVSIAYDSNPGGFCENGMAGVYYITLR